MPDAHFGIKLHKSLCCKILHLQCYKNDIRYKTFKVVSIQYNEFISFSLFLQMFKLELFELSL